MANGTIHGMDGGRPSVMAMGETAQGFTTSDILSVAASLIVAKHSFALAIVVEAQGSTSARAGAKAIFDSRGTVIAGWVGGGCAESTLAHTAVEYLETETPQMIEVDLNDECSAPACLAVAA